MRMANLDPDHLRARTAPSTLKPGRRHGAEGKQVMYAHPVGSSSASAAPAPPEALAGNSLTARPGSAPTSVVNAPSRASRSHTLLGGGTLDIRHASISDQASVLAPAAPGSPAGVATASGTTLEQAWSAARDAWTTHAYTMLCGELTRIAPLTDERRMRVLRSLDECLARPPDVFCRFANRVEVFGLDMPLPDAMRDALVHAMDTQIMGEAATYRGATLEDLEMRDRLVPVLARPAAEVLSNDELRPLFDALHAQTLKVPFEARLSHMQEITRAADPAPLQPMPGQEPQPVLVSVFNAGTDAPQTPRGQDLVLRALLGRDTALGPNASALRRKTHLDALLARQQLADSWCATLLEWETHAVASMCERVQSAVPSMSTVRSRELLLPVVHASLGRDLDHICSPQRATTFGLDKPLPAHMREAVRDAVARLNLDANTAEQRTIDLALNTLDEQAAVVVMQDLRPLFEALHRAVAPLW